MGTFLLFLSLLAVISCQGPQDPHQSPCDSTYKLTRECKKEGDFANCDLVYKDHSFSCPDNDTILFIPAVLEGGYRIELVSIECNETSKIWDARERMNDEVLLLRTIWITGKLQCKGKLRMSCAETRLDYNEYLDDRGAKDPIRVETSSTNGHKYRCEDQSHRFFYTPKFTLTPKEGRYLRGTPICEKSILTAKFTNKEEPVEISYLGSITCKPFNCLESNDAPYTWPLILEVDDKCLQWPDCKQINWFNEKFPCGVDGHEMVVYRSVENKEQWFWLKDHYFKCEQDTVIRFIDTEGNAIILDKDKDKIVCRKPFNCEPLMSEDKVKYGCQERSSCHTIEPSLIPFSHLSSFDGRCYQKEKILKIVTDATSKSVGVELDLISCRYGKWRLTRAADSISNSQFDIEDVELKINKTTNFVCEGRVEYDCYLPKFNCEEAAKNSVKTMCSRAESKSLNRIDKCGDGMELVLRTKYDDGLEKVEHITTDVVCNRRTGKWISTAFPFIDTREGITKDKVRWSSYFVCAKVSCDAFPSECLNQEKCETVESPKYWLNAACIHPKRLYYSHKKIKVPTLIENLHCDKSTPLEGKIPWKFDENGVRKQASKDDNFFCLEEDFQKLEKKNRGEILKSSSPECNPTQLDSICMYDVDICVPVTKRSTKEVTEWECDDETRSLWFYSTGSKKRQQLKTLNCSHNGIFWMAYKEDEPGQEASPPFTPTPHSNIVCLSVDSSMEENKKADVKVSESEERSVKNKRDWYTDIPIPETVALFISLLIFALSLTLFVWARRKYYKERPSDH